jgi:uncharacterized protein YfaS (alpha-2-macroglobulin family)
VLNGQVIQTLQITPERAAGPDLLVRIPAAAMQRGSNTLTVDRRGGTSRVFYSTRMRQTVAMDEIPAMNSPGMSVSREYLRVLPKKVGTNAWSLQTEKSGNAFGQGDRVLVRLTIKTDRDLAYLILEDPFPSGFESTERGSAEIDEWRYWWTNTDVRDDRIAFFMKSLNPGTHILEYNLRAQTPGLYQALPTSVQGMYNPEIRTESAGDRITIREPR